MSSPGNSCSLPAAHHLPHSTHLDDIDMLDHTSLESREAGQFSPTTPMSKPIPRGPERDFHGNLRSVEFPIINSQPGQGGSTLSLNVHTPPPASGEPSEGHERAFQESPSGGAKAHARKRHLSDRVGRKARSINFPTNSQDTPQRVATTLDFPMDRDLKIEGATLVKELGTVLESNRRDIERKVKPLKPSETAKFLLSGGGGTLEEQTTPGRRAERNAPEPTVQEGVERGDRRATQARADGPANSTTRAATTEPSVSANMPNAAGASDPKTGKVYVNGVWEGNRWKLPLKADLEKDIYAPMVKVISKIMAAFVHCPSGVEREVVDTHSGRFLHKDSKTTSPDLVIRAVGPSFEKPEDRKKDIGYSNIATFIEMKREADMGKGIDAHIQQLAIYARQIFAHQPNRKFLRCILASEASFRLVHFDRSGAEVSERLNIHHHHDLFIRLIVTLTSPDEATLGFDTTIQWKTDVKSGRKVSGTLEYTHRPNGTTKEITETYDLVEIHPIAQHVVRGRATTCWTVKERTEKGHIFVIKDSWCPAGRHEEHKYLLRASEMGVVGVCEYVSHQEGRDGTESFRLGGSEASLFFNNRVSTRIMMKAHGKPLECFTSASQLLTALYDAISAHAQLTLQAGILHRDVNGSNVLLGLDDASVGWRGVLIDLSVATEAQRIKKPTAKEARTGSRFFQSCSILSFLTDLTKEVKPAHNYLGDLEGFFYLLTGSLLGQKSDGTDRLTNDPALRIIRGWDSEDVDTAHDTKCKIFNPGCRDKNLAIGYIRTSWGEECSVLFRKFLEWVGGMQVEMERLRNTYGPQNPKKDSIYKPLLDHASEHYSQVLKMFDEAIIALGGEPASTPPHAAVTSPLAPATGGGPNTLKRPRTRSQSLLRGV